MLNPKLYKKLKDIAISLKDVPVGDKRHFTFIIKRNTILSLGWNDYEATHPASYKHGHIFGGIHSELAAILKFNKSKRTIKKCTFVNIRVNRFNKLSMAKPCSCCINMLKQIDVKKIYYTDFNGDLIRLNL